MLELEKDISVGPDIPLATRILMEVFMDESTGLPRARVSKEVRI
jgi:hypothetical protein